MRLTKEQAVCLTVITGTTCCAPKYVLEDISKRLDRPVLAEEFKSSEFIKSIQDLYIDEFMGIVYTGSGLILTNNG